MCGKFIVDFIFGWSFRIIWLFNLLHVKQQDEALCLLLSAQTVKHRFFLFCPPIWTSNESMIERVLHRGCWHSGDISSFYFTVN